MKTRHRFILLLPIAAICMLGVCGPSSPALAQGQGDQRAEELYKRGRDAIVNNQFPQAYEALSEAWKLRRSYDIAALLGQSEYHLKKFPEAAEHLSFSLRGFPASETGTRRKRVEAVLADARKHVLEVELTATESGADVLVDGRRVGRTPLENPLFLSPGRHTIEGRLEGHDSASVVAEGGAGARQSLALKLTKSAPTAPTVTATTAAPPASSEPAPARHDAGAAPTSRPVWPAYAGAGLALVGAGLGAAFLTIAHGKASDRDDILHSLSGTNPCGANTVHASECARAQKLGDDAMKHQSIAQGAFVFAGVAAAFTAAYLLWPASKGPAVTAYTSPGGAGVQLFGHF